MNMNPLPNEPAVTPAEMSFQALPVEVKARLLAQHCSRLLADNERLAAENKHLRDLNHQLRIDATYQNQTMAALQRDKTKLVQDLSLYRKFVKSNSVLGIFNNYCRANARTK